ncbi:hypothetical protein [Nostoc sp. T09]|uniref:hypothetical protein n=1 Tax=Nostoc sp. T09 TaxID=1932621 RepID=UPI0011802CCB|nr:hypothetical protein [Nostoc sp. T09]
MTERLKPGYYVCPACNQRTLHYWALPLTMQDFETRSESDPLPDEVFVCARCESNLSDRDWEQLNSEEYY